MGQYYFIVNLNKKEFLYPHEFDNGLKLLEFGCSSESTLLALTMLLADGNGRGGGDIYSPAYRKAEEQWSKKREEFYKGKRKRLPLFPRAEKYNSPLIGSWAGDRIVIAGDYADYGKFMTQKQIRQYQAKYRKEQPKDRQRYMKSNTTLYNFAEKFFTDISKKCLAVLIDCGEISEKKQKGIVAFDTARKKITSLRPDIVITAGEKKQ